MKKYLSLIIVFSFIIFIIGCSAEPVVDDTVENNPYLNPKEAVYVEEGTPWYTSRVTEYWSHNNQGGKSFVGCCSNYLMLFYNNYEENYRSLEIYEDDSLDYIDIPLDEDSVVENCFSYNDILYAICNTSFGDESFNTIYQIDLQVGEFINPIEIDINVDNAHDVRVEKVMARNDKFYVEYSYYTDFMTEYGFIVMTPDGTLINQYSVSRQINTWSMDENNNIVCFTYGGVIRVNSDTGIEEPLNINGDLYEKYMYENLLDDCCAYVASFNSSEITRLNMNTLEEEVLLDIFDCDISYDDVSMNEFVYGDGENFLIRRRHASTIDELNDVVLIEINKASTNPNVGKQILTVATRISPNQMCSQAVRDFNNTNDEYFIKLDISYSPNDFDDTYNPSQAIDTLKNDIVNGCGPDMIMDFGLYPTLNYDEYLINTISLIDGSDGLNREEYFNNILEAFTIDNRLYQIPLSANVEGLYVDNDFVNINGTGFSYEEYEEHVSGIWEGLDPFQRQYTSSAYLDIAMRNNYYEFHDSDGLLHIDNDEFRRIAEFASSLPQVFSDLGEHYHPLVEYTEFASFQRDLLRGNIYENYSFYGIPSIVENGPAAYMSDSIAITTCTSSYDASWSFVKYLMSYDVQCLNTNNPINILAWRDTAENKVDNANNSMFFNGVSRYDYSIIPIYESYLLSATTPSATDVYMMTLINEEMQAYYDGQKSLDNVIAIIENRVNTMVSERSC